MKKEKILIVEDEMIISATIEETLNNIGYHNIETAYNAKTASELLHKNNYDLVLMDINLGKGADGVDVIAGIKEKKEVPVIYVTGNSDNKTVSKAKTTTPYGFINKPINEVNLKIQLDLAFYKEKIKKLDIDVSYLIENIYEGGCTGLNITLSLDGNILYLSPHIRTITGRQASAYVNKMIGNAGFDKEFYDLLRNMLDTVINSEQRNFYGSIYSPYFGQRAMKINVAEQYPFSFTFHFTDITEASGNSIKEKG